MTSSPLPSMVNIKIGTIGDDPFTLTGSRLTREDPAPPVVPLGVTLPFFDFAWRATTPIIQDLIPDPVASLLLSSPLA